MHKYQLTFFEKLIRQELKQKTGTQKHPDENFYIITIAQVQEEKRRILDSFSNYLFDLNNEKQVEWTVQAHQRKIILLSDEVADQLTKEELLSIASISKATAWANLYKIIYSSLAELLTLIETDYAMYLDHSAKIPVSYLLSVQQKFIHSIASITENLTSAGINEQLLAIILQPFQELTTGHKTVITYHGLIYLKIFIERLSNLAAAITEGTDINKQVQDLSLELNFNSHPYYAYCTTTIKQELEGLPTKEKLERLIWMQKQVNQMQVKPGFIYNPLQAPLQQQLQGWLAEEISCTREVYQLSHYNHPTDEILRWKGFKVLTNFSVSQMGNMIKLLVDTGFFLNNNKTELLEFYSYFYASVQQDDISPGSLRKNFYTEDASVSAGVRGVLKQLIDQSKKGLPLFLITLLSF